jgi:hypothetical protein
MHVIYNSEYFSFYTTVYHYLILHEGLTFFNNEIALLSFNHNAFRKGNSTTDHLFLPQSFGKHFFVVSSQTAD